MKHVAWLTDIHLNFAKPPRLAEFCDHVLEIDPDVVLIGGDIAASTDVVHYLKTLDERWNRPICFVLGNHDFYFGSISRVRHDVRQMCADRANLSYLTDIGPVELTCGVGLIGHDSWADARIGDYERSMVMMNDYRLIAELSGVGKQDRWPLLKAMGDAAAADVRRTLPTALNKYDAVYFLTHVPPFREACWYEGRISDDEWAPHFTCKAVGDALIEIMRDYPHRQLTVLCGHTHGAGETRPQENIRVFTGGAEYGFPAINRLFDVR